MYWVWIRSVFGVHKHPQLDILILPPRADGCMAYEVEIVNIRTVPSIKINQTSPSIWLAIYLRFPTYIVDVFNLSQCHTVITVIQYLEAVGVPPKTDVAGRYSHSQICCSSTIMPAALSQYSLQFLPLNITINTALLFPTLKLRKNGDKKSKKSEIIL